MAENEVLDVGNRRRYRRWREALGDPNLSPADIAGCLPDEFVSILRNTLRRGPLYLILKACDQDRGMLREAINNFKDRDMAKLVERAHAITRSANPFVVAQKLAELLVDKFVDRANRYALKHDHNTNVARHAVLAHETSARLAACFPEIIGLLAASLRGDPIRRGRDAPKRKVSAKTLNAMSLSSLPVEETRPGGPTNA